MYTSVEIANSFLQLAKKEKGVPPDPMKIQKLVYIAHGWYLAYTEEPLCSEIVQAWRWGPVLADLYFAVKHWGRQPITEPIEDYWEEEVAVVPKDDLWPTEIIKFAWGMYQGFTGPELSRLTHTPGTPWWEIVHVQKKPWYTPIPDELIQRHYVEKLDAARTAHAASG